MIILSSGSGAQEYFTSGVALENEQWARVRQSAHESLQRDNSADAVRYFAELPFRLYDASNGFGDRFTVLECSVPREQYLALAQAAVGRQLRPVFDEIASAVSSLVPDYVRFVAVDVLRGEQAQRIPDPPLERASATVTRALADAQHLMVSSGPASALDRAHTAFHGYLKSSCTEAGIEVPADAATTTLFKLLRERHQRFRRTGPEADHVEKILRSLAAVVDAINPIRNRASLAHPNETILDDAEALLVVNSIRTLFSYVHSRVEDGGAK